MSPGRRREVARPRLVKLNRELAEELGLDAGALDSEEGARIFAGNETPEGSGAACPRPSRSPVRRLRASTGRRAGAASGRGDRPLRTSSRYSAQRLGPTPFSRAGDGRAALGPVFREYLIGEAMHAMGIPTTRALAAVLTAGPSIARARCPGAFDARCCQPHPCRYLQLFAAPAVIGPRCVVWRIMSSIATTGSGGATRMPTWRCSLACATDKRRSLRAGCMWASFMA